MIHGAAHDAVLGAALGADVADDHLAGVHREAHLERGQARGLVLPVQLADRRLHLDGTGDRPPRVVAAGERCAEDGQDAVAHELVDHPVVGHDHVGHRPEIGVQQAQHVFGRQILGELREAAQIRHQQRHSPGLAAEPRPLGRGQQARHDLVAQVAAEQRAHEAVAALEVLGQAMDLLGLAAQRELRLEARQHDRQVERLRDVVAGAAPQRLDDVLGLVAGRHHDHGQIRRGPALAHALEHVEPAEPRHHDVEQHGVEARRPEPRQRRRAVFRHLDQIAALPEATGQHLAVGLVVVHDQQPRAGSCRGGDRRHRRDGGGRRVPGEGLRRCALAGRRLCDRLGGVGRHGRVDALQRLACRGLDRAQVRQVVGVSAIEGLFLEQLRIAQDLVQGRAQIVPEPRAQFDLGVAHCQPGKPTSRARRSPLAKRGGITRARRPRAQRCPDAAAGRSS